MGIAVPDSADAAAAAANECTVLDAQLPPDATQVRWTPATFLSDPTSPTPQLCGVTHPLTYRIAYRRAATGAHEYAKSFTVRLSSGAAPVC